MATTPAPPVEIVPISRLYCSPTNPRSNDAAVPQIAASLRRFGWQQPVVARPDGEVIAGNTRLKAAQQLGMTEVPVWWFHGTDLDATAYAIADNRTHEFAQWNDAELIKLLEHLKAEDSLDGVGYGDEDIDALVEQLRAQEEVDLDLDDDGAGEPPAVAIAQRGDLWLLGDHRLLCGDSTCLPDVLRLMDGDKAALVATDPPYLVDYTGERPNDSGKDWTDSYREIDIEDADGFFRSVFANVLELLGPKAAISCWHALERCGDIQRIWHNFASLAPTEASRMQLITSPGLPCAKAPPGSRSQSVGSTLAATQSNRQRKSSRSPPTHGAAQRDGQQSLKSSSRTPAPSRSTRSRCQWHRDRTSSPPRSSDTP